MPTILNGLRPAALAAALLLAAVGGAPALADIQGYNAAMKKGDVRTASNEAEEVWASWDRSDPDTALMAREFGFAALAAGLDQRAAAFGNFLVKEGAVLRTPDDQPATSLVLLRAAELKLKSSDKGREALREALTARTAAPGVDMTSALAWELLYLSDWNAGDWSASSKTAAAAAVHLQRGGEPLATRVSEAEVLSAAAGFMGGRARQTVARNDLYTAMADAHDRVVDRINAAATPAARRGHWESKWYAEAWAIAIESYLTSSYQQIGTHFNTKLVARELKLPEYGEIVGEPDVRPFCKGDFKGGKLTYPASKSWSGMVGSVILRITTDETGQVTSVKELGAVPTRGFASGVQKTIGGWRYVADKDAEPGCRLKHDDLVYRVMFVIG